MGIHKPCHILHFPLPAPHSLTPNRRRAATTFSLPSLLAARMAPKTITYDFACALGPYCLAREPAFFAKTLFAIDQLHRHDHTKCSRAYFLETLMDNDLALSQLHSSAAECGSSGLSRFRKMVSYCKQENAVLLLRHFLNPCSRRVVNGASKE